MSAMLLSGRCSIGNAERLQLHALTYNLANFMRTLALPEAIKDWSLTSLREKLVKIGAKVAPHGRYVIFQMAEEAVPKELFQEILRLIAELRRPPAPSGLPEVTVAVRIALLPCRKAGKTREFTPVRRSSGEFRLPYLRWAGCRFVRARGCGHC
jgi:hypothetical protein